MASTAGSTAQWSGFILKSLLRPRQQWICNTCARNQQQIRSATTGISANAAKYRRNKDQAAAAKKKKQRNTFIYSDPKKAEQFALCDAMRYIRAFEVGQPPQTPKYELHVRLRTMKSGPVVRNRLRLPNPVKTDLRIAVICAPDSKAAQTARAAGASLVGETAIFDAVKAGRIEFERCVCHADSLPALQRAGVARILGPRGLMPSVKLSTVTKDVASAVRNMVGGSEYRERDGTVRLAIGQLGFSPEMVRENVRALMEQVKKDCAAMSDRSAKDVHEVVLSSTHSPGFSLNGAFKSDASVQLDELS